MSNPLEILKKYGIEGFDKEYGGNIFDDDDAAMRLCRAIDKLTEEELEEFGKLLDEE